MKTMIAFAGAAIVAAQLVATPVAAAPAGDAFNGTWTSTDFDGSNQQLVIRGAGATRAAQYYDDEASNACGGAPARVSGPAFVDGDTLVARGVVVCMSGPNPHLGHIFIAYQHDIGTDTLTDDSGIVWTRS